MKYYRFTKDKNDYRAVKTDRVIEGLFVEILESMNIQLDSQQKQFCVQFNRLIIEPGKKDQYHYHKFAYDFFAVDEGEVTFFINDSEKILRKGDCILVEPGDKHMPSNNTSTSCFLTEVRLNLCVPNIADDRFQS